MGDGMITTYNYWISLIHSNELDELELEIKDEIFKMVPYMEPNDIQTTQEDAINIAEGYNYE